MINILVLFYALIAFFSQIVIFYIFNLFTNNKIVFSKKLGIIIIISTIIELFLAQVPVIMINGVICITYFIIITKIFSKLKFKEVIFYNVVIWLFIIVIDMFIMLIFNGLQLLMPFLTDCTLIVKPLATIIMDLILIFLVKRNFVRKIVNKAYINTKKINFSYLMLVIILICYFVLDVISISNLDNELIIEIMFISSIFFTVTMIKFITYRYEILTLKETNLLLNKNNQFYIKLLDDYRILKHNLTNQLLGIKSVANKKSKMLIEDIIKEYNATFHPTADVKNIPNGLNGIIYEKIYNFNKSDLKIVTDNNLKNDLFQEISARSYNLLCEALGVIIDNALDAAYNSEEKLIYFKFDENEDKVIITVLNTFTGEMDLENLGTINYTTKKNGHGLGLYSLIGRSKIKVMTKIKNNLFINNIKIDKNK